MKSTASSHTDPNPQPPLEERKQRILRAIVRAYVETAEPVGSEVLAERYDFGVKSATLRNEMAEMADQGYLQQPHTSAGRIPSDKGYRYYVDWLITPQAPRPVEQQRLRSQLDKARREVESVLQQTCRMLSALTHYVSMATPPALQEDLVRQVHLATLDRDRLLVVLAFETGRVEHAVVSAGVDLLAVDLGRVERLVGAAVRGRACTLGGDAGPDVTDVLPPDAQAVYRAVVGAVADALARIRAEESGDVLVEGTAQVLSQPEFGHVDTIRDLMLFLEERRRLFSLLQEVYLEESQVVIGSEHRDRRMQMCSMVLARYTVLGRYAGSIGVLGPTRMDYDRTLPVVRFMARSVSEVLTKLSL